MIVVHISWFFALICKKEKCKKTLLGETKQKVEPLFIRPLQLCHESNTKQSPGENFSRPGQSWSDLSIAVNKQSKRNDNLYRKEIEENHNECIYTFYKASMKKKMGWVGFELCSKF